MPFLLHRFQLLQSIFQTEKTHRCYICGVTPYAWRHLFGTDLHRAKIPPAIAMMIMGHTEDKTHRRYVNDYQRLAAQAAAELEEYRKKKTG